MVHRCGIAGRALASDTRDPRFESRHRQLFSYIFQLHWKEENNEKRPEVATYLENWRIRINESDKIRHLLGQLFSCVMKNLFSLSISGLNKRNHLKKGKKRKHQQLFSLDGTRLLSSSCLYATELARCWLLGFLVTGFLALCYCLPCHCVKCQIIYSHSIL